MVLSRFSQDLSLEFLKSGFREAGMRIKEEELEDAVNTFDGVVGWLTLYGYLRVARGLDHGKALEEVFREAKAIVESELSRLFSYSPRYRIMLKAIALGYSRWRDVRDYVTLKLGYINDSNFSKLLENLVKSGYVEKKGCRYYIFDPVIERIFRGGVACSSR